MRDLLTGMTAALLLLPAAPALAQRGDAPVTLSVADVQRTDRRLGKLEAEMRAVQRKVFPGGAGAMAPEITAPEPQTNTPAGQPASNPVTALSERVGAMERQLRSLTGQVEASEFKVRQMEEALKRLQGDVEFRLNRLEAPAGGEAGGDASVTPEAPTGGVAVVTPPPASQPGSRPGRMVPPVGTAPVAAPKPAPQPAPPAAPVVAEAAPAGILKGATAAADWQKAYSQVLSARWAATEAHMTAYLSNWPASTRIPQAQYWLGRSFAERGQHAQAADAYLKVYNNHPRSERASDALLGLATALIGIKNPQQACRVLGELDSVYGSGLNASQKAQAQGLRGKARC